MGIREEISWDVVDGRWKQFRKFVAVSNPEGRLIRKEENKLPPEMENVSATIKQTLEQMGIKDVRPGPAGAWSGTLTDTDQIRQLSALQNVGMVIEGPEGARKVSVYPMMIPEQKEESRNDVGSLNSPGYFTSTEKAQVKKYGEESYEQIWNEYNRNLNFPDNRQGDTVEAIRITAQGFGITPEEVERVVRGYQELEQKEEANCPGTKDGIHDSDTYNPTTGKCVACINKEEVGQAQQALEQAAQTQTQQAETIATQADQLNQVLEQLRTSVEETKRIADEMKASAGS